MSSEKQQIWDEYQPQLTEINNKRNTTKNPGELCQAFTKLVEERNHKIASVN